MRQRSKSRQGRPWGLLLGIVAIVVVWLIMTVSLVPDLHDKLAQIKPFPQERTGDEGDGDARTHITRGGEKGTRNSPQLPAPPHVEQPLPPARLPPPSITMDQIMGRLRSFLFELHVAYAAMKPGPEPETVWETYKDIADRWLLPLDRTYFGVGTFPVRDDDSIFVSVASYRDENCGTTLEEMYGKASLPDKLFVGLVQQNCRENCRTGVLEGGAVDDAPADPDCYEEFCATDVGRPVCQQGQVRNLFVNESESLGPAVARYFASKMWHGETFFMQIDSHSLFEHDWDAAFVRDIKNTPSYPKSVLSHYPPDTKAYYHKQAGYRICDAVFARDAIEMQIVRLGGAYAHEKKGPPERPCPAPFVGAGFGVAASGVLRDV
ncbi:unnamed protein product, partial [Phaeothamnion confervicola]